MATASLLLVADYKNRALLSAMGSRLPASTPQFVQGDNVAVEIHLVTVSSSFTNPTTETAIPASATVYLAVGTPGSTPIAQASLSTALGGNLGRSGTLSLNTAEVESFLAGAASKPATLEIEMTEQDGTVTTLAQVACTVFNDLIEAGGVAPNAVPSIVADIADMRADLDALRGGVPLTGWANSTAYPFGTCTMTGGIPSALEFAGSTDDFAYAELALTDFAPDTLDISGTVTAGTVELTELSLVFLDGAGAEAGTIGALTLGAAFSFSAVVVPAGAVKVAVKALGTAATSSLSAGFSALSVTAHAALSVLTAEALDDILAAKAQADDDAGTIAALVPGAQLDAEAAATARETAQVSAIDAAAAELAAETSATNAVAHELAAYNAMVSAGNSNKVATDDWRLGRRGGVRFLANNHNGTALTAVTPFELRTLSVCFRDGETSSETQALCGTQTHTAGKSAWYLRPPNNWSSSGWYWFETNAVGANRNPFGGALTVPAGTAWIHICYEPVSRLLQLFADNASSPFASCTRPADWGDLMPCAFISGGWYAGQYSARCTITDVTALNFVASTAERINIMRHELLERWYGGTPAPYVVNGAWTDTAWTSSGGTITTNSAGVLAVSIASASAANALQWTLAAASYAPLLFRGRVLRIRYTATVTTSGLMLKVRQLGDLGVLHTILNGTNVIDVPVISIIAGAYSETSALILVLDTQTAPGGTSLTIQDVSVEVLGSSINVSDDTWTRSRGFDTSGNSNDLIYGAATVPLDPRTRGRLIKASAGGASIASTMPSSIGAISGISYRDRQSVFAIRTCDALTVNWAQARPPYCSALQVNAASNGTPVVEASGLGGTAVIAAGALLNLIQTV